MAPEGQGRSDCDSGAVDPFRPGDISDDVLNVLAASGVPFDYYLVNDFVKDAKLATSYKVVLTFGVDWDAEDRRGLKLTLDAAGVTVKAAGGQTPRGYRAIVERSGGYIPSRHGLQVDMVRQVKFDGNLRNERSSH